MIDYRDVEAALADQWPEVLEHFGIELPRWTGRNTINGPCCLCGGDDRAHWRRMDERIALHCRHCAADKMKSPETVLMEYHGWEFTDLVQELAAYAGINERSTNDQRNAKRQPRKPRPINRDCSFSAMCHDKAQKRWEQLTRLAEPGQLPTSDFMPVVPITDSNGEISNLAQITPSGVRWLAKKPHYGGLWVQQGDPNVPPAVCTDFDDALMLRQSKGCTVYCTLDPHVTYWSLANIPQLAGAVFYYRPSIDVDDCVDQKVVRLTDNKQT